LPQRTHRSGAAIKLKSQKMQKAQMERKLKKLTAEQKLQLSLRLYYSAYELKIVSLKKFHPELTDKEIRDRVKTIFSHARS
jgi:hypothetical protein